MKSRLARLMLGASVMAVVGTGSAMAQTGDPAQPLPPKDYNLDANGVDLATGKLYLSTTDLTIGASGGGLSYSRTRRALGGTDNYTTSLNITGSVIDVAIGSSRDTFTTSGGISTAGTGAMLTTDGTLYTYIQSDGTKVVFSPGKSSEVYQLAQYRATSINAPDGRVTTIVYETSSADSCYRCYNLKPVSRPSSISSEDGYSISINYNTASPGSGASGPENWFTVHQVLAYNRAVQGGDFPAITYGTDASGTETHTDPMGRQTITTVDSAKRISGIKLPGDSAASTTFAYDSASRVSSVTRAGGTWTYSYADSGAERTTTATSPTQLPQVAVSLLSTGKVLRTRTGTAQFQQFEYDTKGRLTKVTLPEGNYTTYDYDSFDNVITRTIYSKSGTPRVTRATYDCSVAINCHNPITTTDAKSQVTEYDYSPVHGGMTAIRQPAPAAGQSRPERRLTYQQFYASYYTISGLYQSPSPIWKLTAISECAFGAYPACVGTATETRTEILYGAAGTPNNLLPTTITVRAGDNSVSASTSFTYDSVGNIASATDGRGNTTNVYYNAARQTTGILSADPDGSGPLDRPAIDIAYGADGQMVARSEGRVNAQGAFTADRQLQIAYDAYHRTLAQGVVSGAGLYTYTQFGYDADSRPECVAVRMSSSTFTSVPSACALGTTGSDGPDRITRTYYDSAGRVARQSSAVGTADAADEIRIAYTVNGLTDYVTDAMGNRTTNIYDGYDRLSQRNYPVASQGGAASNANDHEEFGYDNNDNLTTRRTRAGQIIQYGYDALNRRLHSSPAGVRGVAYDYDLLGRLTQAAYDNLGGPDAVIMSYDALGRLSSETSKLGGVSRTVSHTFDNAGNVNRITHPDGVYFDWSFDALNRPKNAWWWAPGVGTVPFVAITYDQQGRRSDMNRASSFTGYTYDPISRLNGMNQRFAGNAGNVAVTMGYNPAGQITLSTTDNGDYTFKDQYTVDRPYTTNGLNQYTASGSTALAYDGNGNLTGNGSTTYAYDPENRLISSSTGVTLTYDPLGRLWQTASAGSGKTQFLYDGEHVVAEYDGDTGAMRRRYMWGPGADEPILLDEGSAMNCSGTRFAHPDERGSIAALAGCSGNRLGVQTYDEYGVPDPANAGVNQGGRFGYTGQMWIPELGLWYYKARMYSPTLGRFFQTDPIGYADGLNWYNYVGADPVNATDPSGLAGQSIPLQQIDADVIVNGPSRSGSPRGGTNVIGAVVGVAKLLNQGLCAIGFGIFGGCKKSVPTIAAAAPAPAETPQNGDLTCKGTATFSAVGPLPQAGGDSAFAPGTKPANGTVAIAGAQTFGFGRRALRQGAAAGISISPEGLDDVLRATGGPQPPYTVGDYGDVNIRNAPGSRFDIYRFSTMKGALAFGKRTVPVTITVPAGGHCPPGTSAQ